MTIIVKRRKIKKNKIKEIIEKKKKMKNKEQITKIKESRKK